jgi:hypothetical protein
MNLILILRNKNKFDLQRISTYLIREYQIQLFLGEILKYFSFPIQRISRNSKYLSWVEQK